MPTRFYLHRSLTPVSGTFPATFDILSGSTATYTPGVTNGSALTPLLPALAMDPTISPVAQTSLAYSTAAVTTNQKQPLLRFVSPPLAAQTIASQQILLRCGLSQSNTISAFAMMAVVAVWRPSTGALVGRLHDGPIASVQVGSVTTTQGDITLTMSAANVTAVTAQAGDVLVVEMWRGISAQTMGTSYTNTIFYDGTTVASITNVAAYLEFTNNITLDATWIQPIVLRSFSTGNVAPPTTSITLPAGVATGDLLVLTTVQTNVATEGPTAPSGWTRAYGITAGTGTGTMFHQVFTAPYSAALSLTFTAPTNCVGCWICGAYYQAGQTLEIDPIGTNPVSTINTTSNTTLPTGAPTTGSRPGDYELLFHSCTSNPTIPGVPSGAVIDVKYSNNIYNTVSLSHSTITSLPASTLTSSSFNFTLSAANAQKIGTGILIRPVVTGPSMPALSIAGPADAFN